MTAIAASDASSPTGTLPAPRWLPFAGLHLRVNPFGEWTAEDRVAMAILDLHEWSCWLTVDRHALQMVGECGRGKTTHLLAIAHRIEGAAYLYLPPRRPCPPLPCGRPLLIDEAQRLPIWKRYPLLRRGVPLVLGTHRDLSGPLRRAGYAVQTIDLNAAPDPARLHKILNRRIEFARLDPGPVPQVTLADAELLIRRFGSNIRAAEHYLYQQVQKQAGVDCGQMRLVD